MAEFVSSTGVGSFDHIADDDLKIWSEFGVTSQPAFAFLNDDGTVKTIVSRLGEDRLAEEIEALL